MKEILEIIEAYGLRKTIQRFNKYTNEWVDFDFNTVNMKYLYTYPKHFRIKPEQFRLVARGYRKSDRFYVMLSDSDLNSMREMKKYKVIIEEIEG